MGTVSDIMTTAVRNVNANTRVCEIAGIFASEKISGAPVVDDVGTMVGFVSNADVTNFESTGEDPYYARVSEIVSPNVISISPTTSIEEAARRMLASYVHHLLVIERDTIVGILSSFDFVKMVAANADANTTGSAEHRVEGHNGYS